MENMIKITGVDLRAFVQAVYDLSRPQGLGVLHYQEGSLTDEEADMILNTAFSYAGLALALDYVHGRACKMSVYREDGDLFISNRWFDHSDSQLAELLERVGIKDSA